MAEALPGCIAGIAQDTPKQSNAELLMTARRSGGKTRIRWVDGVLEVAQ